MSSESIISDHDLLITLHEQVKGIRIDIAEIKDNTKFTINDHENRIRNLEKRGWMVAGGLGFIAAVAPYFWNLIKSN